MVGEKISTVGRGKISSCVWKHEYGEPVQWFTDTPYSVLICMWVDGRMLVFSYHVQLL